MNANELNLLVVDDDAFQRRVNMDMLRALGVASICVAENGRQALERIQKEDDKSIDVVLSDLNMPEMDGLEFLRLLGQEQRNVALIIVSSLNSKLLLSAGKMAKLYGIVLLGVAEKPMRMEQLKELLAKHERVESRWRQPEVQMDFTLKEILHAIHLKQFEPFFQPKVDLKTGALIGAEALARWHHPEQGLVSPYAFIPKLEQSGNIDGLTFLMLEKAALACRSFRDQGYPISISVNLSLSSLDDTLLADNITQIVRNAGLDPQHIMLEVTESAAMTDVARALENLTRLCMNGFALSIDDYGTGYSSLQQLMRIPFSELKIDKSFVTGFAEHETQRIMVESSIDMAHKLEVKCLAEGVETQQDLDTLKAMGCDAVQGYFIARPMDAVSFVDFCSRHVPEAFSGTCS